MESYSKQVIVFGSTGPVGTKLVEIISKEHVDWKILASTRDVTKSSRLKEMNLPNVELVQVDPVNKAGIIEASKTCDILFCCIGFQKYERKYWAKYWPVVMEGLLEATGSNKKLVYCDNIYAYGPGTKISPQTQRVPASNKGKPAVRAKLHQMIQEHMAKNPGTVTVVGGADFLGPHADNTVLGQVVIGKIVKDESAMAIGSCSVIHDFCYVPDFAQALAVVAEQDRAYDKFWICPHSIHGKTIQEIANDAATMAGKRSPVKITVLNKFMCYLLSPFMGFMGEMIEMLPFWTKDYTVDDSDFMREFGVNATPYEQALCDTVTFYEKEKK